MSPMTQSSFRLKIASLCFINNKKAYLATFSSKIDKYDSYQKVANDILSSFSRQNKNERPTARFCVSGGGE